MATVATGHCNCRLVTVEVNGGLPASSLLCHCLNCRASGGTVFSTNLVVKKADIVITGEEHTKVYRDTNTASGNVACRRFCASCGRCGRTGRPILLERGRTDSFLCNPTVTFVESNDETQFLKAGLFGPNSMPPPSSELFKHRAEPWEKLHEGAEWQ
ncbi:hypothetical protein JCM3770_005497 [Rhodotorula araucariae]